MTQADSKHQITVNFPFEKRNGVYGYWIDENTVIPPEVLKKALEKKRFGLKNVDGEILSASIGPKGDRVVMEMKVEDADLDVTSQLRGIGNDTLDLYADWAGYKNIAAAVTQAIRESGANIFRIDEAQTGTVYVLVKKDGVVIKIRIANHERNHRQNDADINISPVNPFHQRRDLKQEITAALAQVKNMLAGSKM
jgi:hypothetical protein